MKVRCATRLVMLSMLIPVAWGVSQYARLSPGSTPASAYTISRARADYAGGASFAFREIRRGPREALRRSRVSEVVFPAGTEAVERPFRFDQVEDIPGDRSLTVAALWAE